MTTKVWKISASETRPADGSLTIADLGRPHAVDDPRLGGAELDPVAHRVLETDEELVGVPARLVVQLVGALELALEGELPDQRLLIGAPPPRPDVGVAL